MKLIFTDYFPTLLLLPIDFDVFAMQISSRIRLFGLNVMMLTKFIIIPTHYGKCRIQMFIFFVKDFVLQVAQLYLKTNGFLFKNFFCTDFWQTN